MTTSKNILTLRTCIHTQHMRYMMWRGTGMAAVGILLLVFSEIFLHPQTLAVWGLPIFLVSIVLITAGLLPYRRLRRLESSPNVLNMDADHLEFYVKKRLQFSLPLNQIVRIIYVEEKDVYGIGFILKSFSVQEGKGSRLHQKTLQRYGCDVLLQYFSRRSFEELKSSLS